MRIPAHAKLNRFLVVLARREDGFHELELVTTVLEKVPGLTDQLIGEKASQFHLDITGSAASGLRADSANLVVKAWRMLEEEVGHSLPAALSLEKRIPMGAGLGGGSSNAAAALKLGNALYDLGISEVRLLAMAAVLGSDVPLFLLGGTVLGLGRGERVFPLRHMPLEPILLIHPGWMVKTPSVYAALKKVGYPKARHCPSLAAGMAPPWKNDLTDAAIMVCPEMEDIRHLLLELGGDPLLCGSGSSWAARFPDEQSRDDAYERVMAQRKDWSCWCV